MIIFYFQRETLHLKNSFKKYKRRENRKEKEKDLDMVSSQNYKYKHVFIYFILLGKNKCTLSITLQQGLNC